MFCLSSLEECTDEPLGFQAGTPRTVVSACMRGCVSVSVCKREILIADAHLFFFWGHPLLIDLCVITFGMTGSVI